MDTAAFYSCSSCIFMRFKPSQVLWFPPIFKKKHASRPLQNEATGIDLQVPLYQEVRGSMMTGHVEYQIVVITRLTPFKSAKHKPGDVIQFVVSKKYSEIDEFYSSLSAQYPSIHLPAMPRKALFVGETDIRERRVAFDELVRFIAKHPTLSTCPELMEFLDEIHTSQPDRVNKPAKVGKPFKEEEGDEEELFDPLGSVRSKKPKPIPKPAAKPKLSLFDEEEDPDKELFQSDMKSNDDVKLFEDPDLGGAVSLGDSLLLPSAYQRSEPPAITKLDGDVDDLFRVDEDLDKLLVITKPVQSKPAVAPKPAVKAKPYEALVPEDQDGSGDDEFSGSGSGDDDNWIFDVELPSQASPNTTKTPWSTDAPVTPSEHSFIQIVSLDTEPETSDHLTEAPLPQTTQIPETTPSVDVIKPFGSGEVPQAETTTVSTVAQPETTVPPAVELPVMPEQEDEYTTTVSYEEETTDSSVLDQEEEETTVETLSLPTDAPDMETTPMLLSTTPDSNSADTEASGDLVESTTVKGDGINFTKTNISDKHGTKAGKPRMNDNDFDFDNEIQKPGLKSDLPGSGSDFAKGSNSDNDSLLERKEVLAGVIAGGVVGLAFAVLLIALMVYRMKKKDEGSYSLDEHKHPNGGYQKPQKQEEFLA
ncbi:HCLS1-binding protein 3 [Bagarius yarrelli]|uniref:Syndecan n=1 Tax=Bagarius yarrelli TaxID=175774 RepID=A0A556U525_BAGYA|nr:HCLS1-binding protein 3 [Bagarius yarrelli]